MYACAAYTIAVPAPLPQSGGNDWGADPIIEDACQTLLTRNRGVASRTWKVLISKCLRGCGLLPQPRGTSPSSRSGCGRAEDV